MLGKLTYSTALIWSVLILCTPATLAGGKDDWKAPPPLKEKRPDRVVKKIINPMPLPGTSPVRIDPTVPQSATADLPYLRITGYDLKIAFSPTIMDRYGLKSGDEVSAELMYAIIDAEREFEKSRLR